jgi:mono/diheme cytochrome c family protein
MRRGSFFWTGGLSVAFATIGWLALAQTAEVADGLTFLREPVTSEQIDLGKELYGGNCASCHGANLEGQPNWKRRLDTGRMPAPPHDATGHTWHHSDRNLFTVTNLGVGAIVPGYESDMPAFEGTLTDADIVAVLAFIKSTWPERQRDFQAEVTANDRP